MPTLIEFGIDAGTFRQALPAMAQQALASGSPQNNPRVPSEGEIIELYSRLLS